MQVEPTQPFFDRNDRLQFFFHRLPKNELASVVQLNLNHFSPKNEAKFIFQRSFATILAIITFEFNGPCKNNFLLKLHLTCTCS